MCLDRVSIVIVTYKGDEVLTDCLSSLSATCGNEPQIVVVDNDPSFTTKVLVGQYPNAIYVESPGNPGFAGGNNRALPHCDRDYVLLLNNDTVVRSRQSIEDLVKYLESHPVCGVVQGSIILPKAGNTAGGCGSFLTPFGFLYTKGFIEKVDESVFGTAHHCFSAMGAFMMFPRRILGDIGFLFYEHFKSYYEEVDFCHRVWLAGYEVWYVPTEPIEHLCGYTAGKFPRNDIMKQYICNTLFSLSVNLGIMSRMTILLIYRIILLAHAFMHLIKGDSATFISDIGVFSEIFRRRNEIAIARRNVIRRVSDCQVFLHVLRLPRLSYLFRAVHGNM